MARPVDAKFKVTQGYGNKSKLYAKTGGFHKGVDFGTPVGTPVYACWNGKVQHAGDYVHGTAWGPAFGKQIIIDNDKLPDGTSGLWLGYMHLSKVVVKKGQVVKKGDLIGYTGNTGHTTGPHLHLECQKNAHWNKNGSTDPSFLINA